MLAEFEEAEDAGCVLNTYSLGSGEIVGERERSGGVSSGLFWRTRIEVENIEMNGGICRDGVGVRPGRRVPTRQFEATETGQKSNRLKALTVLYAFVIAQIFALSVSISSKSRESLGSGPMRRSSGRLPSHLAS